MIHRTNPARAALHPVNDAVTRPQYTLQARQFQLPLGQHTVLMGIINVTPDSFSQDGCLSSDKALRLAKKMQREGAGIIDVGGESSRPGSDRVSAAEESRRVIPVVKRLVAELNIPISVDTYKSSVAKSALDAGASIINNIKGATPDKSLLAMIRDYDAAIVLMHMRGNPKTMQKCIEYTNAVEEIILSLQKSIEICLEIGIKSDKIIIDPGIGFGKTVEHNLEIIRSLKEFQALNQPILIGTSRKSFIGNILDQDVHQRVLGTAATVCSAIMNGAHIVRVHDVLQMKQISTMTDAIVNPQFSYV